MPPKSPPPLPPPYFGESNSLEKSEKKTPEKKTPPRRRPRDASVYHRPKGGGLAEEPEKDLRPSEANDK